MSAFDAANLLIQSRRGGPKPNTLPEQIRDTDWAYRVQALIIGDMGGKVGGWKAGLSANDPPSRAPLPLAGLRWSPVTLPLSQMPFGGIEAEIAFRLARDLPPIGQRYTLGHVADAIDAAATAIELVDTRYADFAKARPVDKLADLGSHFGLVLGVPLTSWRTLPLEQLVVRMTVDGTVVVDQTGGHSAGNPLEAVAWLANHLHDYGDWLRAGQWVTTGAIGGLKRATSGGLVRVEIAGLSPAEAQLLV